MVFMKAKNLNEKKRRLFARLEEFDSLIVAFSGGTDSSFILAAARKVLKKKALAVTADSEIHSTREKKKAVLFAKEIGARHEVISLNELRLPGFAVNEKDRCYICKKNLFEKIRNFAEKLDITKIAHGANIDDLSDFRPGFKAAEELKIAAPLMEAGMLKDEIRLLSKKMNLKTWNKPAAGCLATRMPYGMKITRAALSMVEASEDVLIGAGFEACRVRHHGETARIEINSENFKKILKPAVAKKISDDLKKIGYLYVTLDLEGYIRGRMNNFSEVLQQSQKH